MSTTGPQTPPPQRARYDLLAVNLAMAIISALLMGAVGSSIKVVELLEKTEVAGIGVSLAVGAAVNPSVLTAALAIFFAMSAAVCCAWRNRLSDIGTLARLVSFLSWTATGFALVFFVVTLVLAPLSLAVEVGI